VCERERERERESYVALPSSRMNSSAPLVARPNRVIREAGHVGLMGKREEGVLSDVVPELFILPGLKSMFL